MDRFVKKTADILLYLWQLPQNLFGLLLVAVLGWVTPIDMKGRNTRLPSSLVFLSPLMRGGVSLGRYIILNTRYENDFDTWYHERGHSIQSMILGPLYLLVIGLPSLIWAAWWNEDRNRDYFSFYTERWADHLGGVNRC